MAKLKQNIWPIIMVFQEVVTHFHKPPILRYSTEYNTHTRVTIKPGQKNLIYIYFLNYI